MSRTTVRRQPASQRWASLVAVLDELGDLDPDDAYFPIKAAAIAEQLDTALGDPLLLQELADRVRVVAEDTGCRTLLGASDVGSRLAAAATARGTDLSLFTEATPGAPVLVVESLLISGYQVDVTVASAIAAGASKVVVCAVAEAPSEERAEELHVLTAQRLQ